MLMTVKHKKKMLAQVLSGEKVLSPGEKVPSNKMPSTSLQNNNDKSVINYSLEQDLSALHDLVDVSKKIELKKTALIPKWTPIVDEYIRSGAHHKFEPLVFLAVWMLDAEKLPEALAYADYAIAQQQPMPDRFKRDLSTFMAAGIHDWAQRQYKAGHSAEPYFSQIIDRIENKQWIVTDSIVLGFIYKLAAMFAEEANDLEKAEQFYLKCVDANPEGHGVKTKFSSLLKKLGKALTL